MPIGNGDMGFKTVTLFLFCLSVSIFPGWAEVRFQTFDTDPLWDGLNNFSQAFEPRPVLQEFGYSASTHCNASPGEVGGTVTPDGKPAYYAKPIPPLSFNDSFSASGTLLIPAGSGHVLLGFFNSDTINEWRTPNTVVFRFYGRGDFFYAYFEYGTSLWRAGASMITGPDEIPCDTVYDWSLSYTPVGADGGQIVAVLDGKTAVCDLAPGHRGDGATFNHFGLLNVVKHPDSYGDIWIDDVVVNGIAEDSSQDPGWDAFQNHASYMSDNVRPRFAFGYSATQFVGGGIPGEIGGLFFRGDCRYPERLAYYGDRLGRLTLYSPLEASGKVNFRRGVTDSTTLFGFFNSEHSVAVNPSQSEGLPAEFLGFAIEGPSAEGFFMYPCYRTVQDGRSRQHMTVSPPYIYPNSQTKEWSLAYDPEANGGAGEIRVTLDGQTGVLPLAPGHKEMGAEFNRFGFVTPWIDGNGQVVYFDDLRYTGDVPTAARFSATPTAGFPPLDVAFTDESVSAEPILDWTWDFGDGSPPSHERNPVHTYANDGAYTVRLTITTASGSNTLTRHWLVDVGETLPGPGVPALTVLIVAMAGLAMHLSRVQGLHAL